MSCSLQRGLTDETGMFYTGISDEEETPVRCRSNVGDVEPASSRRFEPATQCGGQDWYAGQAGIDHPVGID